MVLAVGGTTVIDDATQISWSLITNVPANLVTAIQHIGSFPDTTTIKNVYISGSTLVLVHLA